MKIGGGIVGYGAQFDNDDFFRDAVQVAYNLTLGTNVVHEIHVGYQWLKESEDLLRSSNGWGSISVPGGRLAPVQGQRAYYTARIQQQLAGQDACHPLGVADPQLRAERHDQVAELDLQRRRAA